MHLLQKSSSAHLLQKRFKADLLTQAVPKLFFVRTTLVERIMHNLLEVEPIRILIFPNEIRDVPTVSNRQFRCPFLSTCNARCRRCRNKSDQKTNLKVLAEVFFRFKQMVVVQSSASTTSSSLSLSLSLLQVPLSFKLTAAEFSFMR